MSNIEVHRGRLIPMTQFESFGSLEVRAQCVCEAHHFERNDEYHDSWVDCLRDLGYRKFVIWKDAIYKVEDEELDPDGFGTAKIHPNGIIDYVFSYYNGGADFDEAIEPVLNEVDG